MINTSSKFNYSGNLSICRGDKYRAYSEWRHDTCLGIHSGVRDFRWGAGAWNMTAVFVSTEQLVTLIRFVGSQRLNVYNGGYNCVTF